MDSDEAGRLPLRPARGWRGFCLAQLGFLSLAGALLAISLALVVWLGVGRGQEMVWLAWGSCFFGAVAARGAVGLLGWLGVAGERHLVGVLVRPVPALAMFLGLRVAHSSLADVPLAITLAGVYLVFLMVDTVTTVRQLLVGESGGSDGGASLGCW